MNGEREKLSLSKPPASADKEPVFEVHTPIDDDRPIYLVGPFNDWQVDPRFQLRQAAPGRHYVIPDDIKTLTPLTLTHRLILKPESQLRGRTTKAVLKDIVERTNLALEIPTS